MVKLFFQLIFLVAIFFATLWGLNQVDWMTLFHVKEITKSTEEKLGELSWEIYSKMEDEETNKEVLNPIDSLVTRICSKNDIDRKKIKLHILRKDDVNAFALPDNHLVLFTGLVEDCENEAELCGVIAHEIAHMENGHIMKKLIKEMGLAVVVSMTSGKSSPELLKYAVKILSSTAYDRNLESDADLTGVDYLIKANIDPEAFAQFLFRMSAQEKDYPQQIFWISTHPGSEERTKAILDHIAGKSYEKEIILDSVQWHTMKEKIREE